MISRKTAMCSLVLASVLVAGPVLAEADTRGEGVMERARPDYDPIGVRMGSFLLFPSIEIGVGYDDNIGRADTNTTDSYGLTVSPELQLRSQWSRHELNLFSQAESVFYEADSDLDYTNYGVGFDGRIDIGVSTSIEGGASYLELNEELRTVTAPAGASEPTEYSSFDARIQLNHRFNRLLVQVEGMHLDLDYDDVTNNVGGIIDNDLRDRERQAGRLRVGYDVSPGVNLFVEGELNEVDYDQSPPAVAVNRDSDGFRVGAGATFDITKLVAGEVFLGYLEQDFDSVALQDVDGVSAEVDLSWFVTPLTTVNLGIGSGVEQADTTGSGGYLAQTVELGVDHELMRNVIVSAGASFENDDFEGINRDEDIVGFDLSAEYLVNRNASVSLGYGYEERDSNQVGRDYERNRVGLTLRLQL